jgi:DNA polymerase elongation subunit (family B)
LKFYTNVSQRFDKFLVRGYENGRKFIEEVDNYRPTLFVPSNKKTGYTTLDGNPVKPIQPGTPSDCKEFYKTYKDVDGFEIYGMDNYIFQYISDTYTEERINYDTSIMKIYAIDIEVSSENGFPSPNDCIEELLTITLQDFNTKKITTFGVKPYNNTRDDVDYILCNDEKDLCYKFLDFWEANYPDIITGWNTKAYDLPYIVGRFSKVVGNSETKRLSPWGVVFSKELITTAGPMIVCDLLGIANLDYMEIYKKFTYTTQESYALNHIGEVELGEKKLDHSQYDTFKDFYTNDWQLFVDYNIQDTVLIGKLEDKLKLLKLCIMMAYNAKVNYADVFFQVRLWDAIVYNYLKSKNIAIPPKNNVDKDEKFDGAYVKEPTPGMYDYVVSFDLASLYPSLIMMFNISPETIVDIRHPNASVNNILNKVMDPSLYQIMQLQLMDVCIEKICWAFSQSLLLKCLVSVNLIKRKCLSCNNNMKKLHQMNWKIKLASIVVFNKILKLI